jgi:hypothetical protein
VCCAFLPDNYNVEGISCVSACPASNALRMCDPAVVGECGGAEICVPIRQANNKKTNNQVSPTTLTYSACAPP